MSGHPLLLEPTLFNEESTENMLRSDMAIEYCELANKHWALPKHVRYHVFKILTPLLEAHKQLHSFRPVNLFDYFFVTFFFFIRNFIFN